MTEVTNRFGFSKRNDAIWHQVVQIDTVYYVRVVDNEIGLQTLIPLSKETYLDRRLFFHLWGDDLFLLPGCEGIRVLKREVQEEELFCYEDGVLVNLRLKGGVPELYVRKRVKKGEIWIDDYRYLAPSDIISSLLALYLIASQEDVGFKWTVADGIKAEFSGEYALIHVDGTEEEEAHTLKYRAFDENPFVRATEAFGFLLSLTGRIKEVRSEDEKTS